MSTDTKPEWMIKLDELWSRRDSAGFYEFQELITQEKEKSFQEGYDKGYSDGLDTMAKEWEEYGT